MIIQRVPLCMGVRTKGTLRTPVDTEGVQRGLQKQKL